MGYHTDFFGSFDIHPSLKPEHIAYLKQFAYVRHMKRDEAKTALRPDPLREAVGLPVGPEGAYFVGAEGHFGQEGGVFQAAPANDVIDHNHEPADQPGLWCQWVPSEDGAELAWDEGEKFYEYVEWLQYLISHFLEPWGYTVNGQVAWEGEDREDRGRIDVTDNVVKVLVAQTVYVPQADIPQAGGEG